MTTKKIDFTIIVDTREQIPYSFSGSVSKCLNSGDYSVLGLEHEISIERKKVSELHGIVGSDRERFERELDKLSKLQYAAIVIEGNIFDAMQPSPFSNVSPKAVMNSLLSWSVKYGVHIFFAGSRQYGRALTLKLLLHYARHKTSGDIICRIIKETKTMSGKNTSSESSPP